MLLWGKAIYAIISLFFITHPEAHKHQTERAFGGQAGGCVGMVTLLA